jgi:hypothetical protein
MTTLSTPQTTGSAAFRASQDPRAGRGWAWSGVGAGVAGIVAVVASSFAGAVYEEDIAGDAVAIAARMAEQTTQILVFHTAAMVSALLLLVFAAGLRRRLADVAPEGSLLPQLAGSGLLLVSVALLMGSALTTEFVFGVKEAGLLVPETAAMFGHWIGTVPWVWAGAGVAALALGRAGRAYGATAGWLTWTSLVLGGITTLFAISPLQYMAGMTGPIWLTVAAVGLLKKD